MTYKDIRDEFFDNLDNEDYEAAAVDLICRNMFEQPADEWLDAICDALHMAETDREFKIIDILLSGFAALKLRCLNEDIAKEAEAAVLDAKGIY